MNSLSFISFPIRCFLDTLHTVLSVRKEADTEVETMGTFLVLVGFVHRCVNLVLVVLGPVVVVVEVLAVAAVRVGPFHLQII